LYFALTTLAAVGFGDVHAHSLIARRPVVVQMAFNVVVLASAASVLASAACTLTGALASAPAGRRVLTDPDRHLNRMRCGPKGALSLTFNLRRL
jgi:hypothetical protein